MDVLRVADGDRPRANIDHVCAEHERPLLRDQHHLGADVHAFRGRHRSAEREEAPERFDLAGDGAAAEAPEVLGALGPVGGHAGAGAEGGRVPQEAERPAGTQAVVGGGEVDGGDAGRRVHVDVVAGDATHSARAEQLEPVVDGGARGGRFVEIARRGVGGLECGGQPPGGGRGDARHPDLHEVAADVQAVPGKDRAQRARLQLASRAVERRREPALVAEVLVAGDPEVGGANGVRSADLDIADAAPMAGEAVETAHRVGDPGLGRALRRQAGKGRERGSNRPFLVLGQPIARRRVLAVHGRRREHPLRVQRVEGRGRGPGDGVGPAPLRVDARRGVAGGTAVAGEQDAAVLLVPPAGRRGSVRRPQADAFVAGQVVERNGRRQASSRDFHIDERSARAAADGVDHFHRMLGGPQVERDVRLATAERRLRGGEFVAHAERGAGPAVGGEGEGVAAGGGQAQQAAEPVGVVAVVRRDRQVEGEGRGPAGGVRARFAQVRRGPVEESCGVLVLVRIEEVLELEAAPAFRHERRLPAKQVDGDVLGLFRGQVERRHPASRPRGPGIEQERGEGRYGRLGVQVGKRHGGDCRFAVLAVRRVAGDAADGVEERPPALDGRPEAVDRKVAEDVGGLGCGVADRRLRSCPAASAGGAGNRPAAWRTGSRLRLLPAVSEEADDRPHGILAVVRVQRVEHVRHRRARLLLVGCEQVVREPASGGALGDPVEVGCRSDRDALGNRGGRRVTREAVQFPEKDLAQCGLVRGAGEP